MLIPILIGKSIHTKHDRKDEEGGEPQYQTKRAMDQGDIQDPKPKKNKPGNLYRANLSLSSGDDL